MVAIRDPSPEQISAACLEIQRDRSKRERMTEWKSSSYFVYQTLKLTVGHAKEHRDTLGWLDHADKLLIDPYVERKKQPPSAHQSRRLRSQFLRNQLQAASKR